MNAESTIEAYYEALRTGDSLAAFFCEEPGAVKIGVGEELYGFADIARGLRDQTDRTSAWTVDSRSLRVTERELFAWFSDTVRMEWRDDRKAKTYDYDTRWTGTLEYRSQTDSWRFVSIHVSVAVETDSLEDELFGEL